MEQVLISQRATAFTMRMSLFNLAVMPVAFLVGAHWKGTSGVAASWIILAPLTVFPPFGDPSDDSLKRPGCR